MLIDASLKVVLDRRRESDGATFYVYCEAVSRNTAKMFWQVIQGAISKLYMGGGNPMIAPRFAGSAIRQTAEDMGVLPQVEGQFIGEARRLASVMAPTAAGWEQIPFDEAVSKEVISADEADELESAILFFTLVWRFHSTSERREMVSGAASLWKGRVISSSFMEWRDSLPTLNATAASGETTPAPPAATMVKDGMVLSVPS